MSRKSDRVTDFQYTIPTPIPTQYLSYFTLVGSPTNDTLVGCGKGSGVGNENQEGWSSSQEEDQGLEFEE